MKFGISFSRSLHADPITGRLFLIVTRNPEIELRLQLFDVPVFARDVSVIRGRDLDALGIPRNTLLRLVQAGKLERVSRGPL